MRVTFEKAQPESPGITTFYFRPEKPLHYTAGQYIELSVPLTRQPHSETERHWFTLSSSPTQELLSITTRLPSKNRSPYKKALVKLQPGDQLTISEAMGDFVLPKLIQTPLVFVVGGIGITPVHSIITWLANTLEERPIKLLWAVHSEDDIIFQEALDKLKQHATIVVSEPSAAWGGERGQLTAEMILGLETPSDNSLVYISGPDPFVDAMKSELAKHGFNGQRMVSDGFSGYSGSD